MSNVISVEHLSKAYRLGDISSRALHEDLARWWARMRGKPDPLLRVGEDHRTRRLGDLFWALDDVNFDVEDGEVLGVIGRNGAGKSTLLKVLSQVTGPTAGRIKLRGRVASLLEVGTGFHPDLTGRENVFLNGAIMGMTKMEIRKKFDEIVAFSECDEFIDTPVKRYSSGMYVRLAFAVAAHLEPEILFVDEVLAVGDAQFQKKCLGKMGDVSRGGRTVLFVSHNMVAVQSLCRHAILLRDGKLEAAGPAASVVARYLEDAYRPPEARDWQSPADAPGNDAIRIKSVRIAPTQVRDDGLIDMASPIQIDTEFWVLKPDQQLHLTYLLTNEQGVIVLTSGGRAARRATGSYRTAFRFPGALLNSGGYYLKLLIIQNEGRLAYEHESIASFSIVDASQRTHGWMGREPGVVQPPLVWTETAISECEPVLVP
jgi:lipopolysaccharide transport system ATP-binding protein